MVYSNFRVLPIGRVDFELHSACFLLACPLKIRWVKLRENYLDNIIENETISRTIAFSTKSESNFSETTTGNDIFRLSKILIYKNIRIGISFHQVPNNFSFLLKARCDHAHQVLRHHHLDNGKKSTSSCFQSFSDIFVCKKKQSWGKRSLGRISKRHVICCTSKFSQSSLIPTKITTLLWPQEFEAELFSLDCAGIYS